MLSEAQLQQNIYSTNTLEQHKYRGGKLRLVFIKQSDETS